MKAVRIHEDGGPEVLRYEDAPDPVAGAGEVLIELRAASLNHLDIWLRRGSSARTAPGSSRRSATASTGWSPATGSSSIRAWTTAPASSASTWTGRTPS